MKKIVAGVVAAVLPMALCAPAFAATPGEVADDNAREVIGLTQNWNEAGNAEAAETAMQEMVDTLQDSSVTVSTYMTSAGLSYFDALEENGKPGTDYGKEMLYLSDGTVSAVVRYAKTGFSVGGELSVSDDAVITYTANPQHPSSTGYAITVYLPDDATATQYSSSAAVISSPLTEASTVSPAMPLAYWKMSVIASTSTFTAWPEELSPPLPELELEPAPLWQPASRDRSTPVVINTAVRRFIIFFMVVSFLQ